MKIPNCTYLGAIESIQQGIQKGAVSAEFGIRSGLKLIVESAAKLNVKTKKKRKIIRQLMHELT